MFHLDDLRRAIIVGGHEGEHRHYLPPGTRVVIGGPWSSPFDDGSLPEPTFVVVPDDESQPDQIVFPSHVELVHAPLVVR